MQLILAFVGLYLALGALFAVTFVTLGLSRVDRAARGCSLALRLLLLSGVAALWPVMLRKWAGAPRAPHAPQETHP